MENNNGIIKGMLIALLIAYVISPLDLAPGPLDDVLVILLSMISGMKNNGSSRELPKDTVEGSWQEH